LTIIRISNYDTGEKINFKYEEDLTKDEAYKERNRLEYQVNKEYYQRIHKKSREKNKEKHSNRGKKYYLEHKAEVNARHKREREIARIDINNMKKDMMEYLGGKCINCGSTINLEFHHIDPETKLFNITDRCKRSTAQNGWKNTPEMFNEINKCQLLCNKCHSILTGETHSCEYGNNTKFDKNLVLEAFFSDLYTSALSKKTGISRPNIWNIQHFRNWDKFILNYLELIIKTPFYFMDIDNFVIEKEDDKEFYISLDPNDLITPHKIALL
jgi:RNA polymerase subunit RPABC4/transcription elongation factor Spt4